MTTDLFDRYAALDPAHSPEAAPDWAALEPVLLAAIDERTKTMSTQTIDKPVTTRPPRRRIALAIAAAFVAVLAIGGALFAASHLSDNDVADIPAPPFTDPVTAARAFHQATGGTDSTVLYAMLADGYTVDNYTGGTSVIGPTVAETEERMRFNRARGITSTLDGCRENSSISATCSGILWDPGWLRPMFDIDFLYLTLTVRINDEGLITSTREEQWFPPPGASVPAEELPDPPLQPSFSLATEFNRWVDEEAGAPVRDWHPFEDPSGQLDISPEDAARLMSDYIEQFMAQREG